MTLNDLDPEAGMLKMDGFDSCAIGVISGMGLAQDVICYDRELVIAQLATEMSQEEAEEFHEFNQAGAYMGPGTPVFLDRFDG
jgi:hypothetical protein